MNLVEDTMDEGVAEDKDYEDYDEAEYVKKSGE